MNCPGFKYGPTGILVSILPHNEYAQVSVEYCPYCQEWGIDEGTNRRIIQEGNGYKLGRLRVKKPHSCNTDSRKVL